MATKSFLTTSDLDEARKHLKAPDYLPSGDIDSIDLIEKKYFSEWISLKLLKIFSAEEEWNLIHPVALGSWARNEISPFSDIDLLFCGEEELIFKFVTKMQERGIKIRYRVPEDINDWAVGVSDFDILSLLHAKAFTETGKQSLKIQQEIVLKNKKSRQKILRAIVDERKIRNKRYDSISNYLEPNIKYGRGGLRDLQQGLYVLELFKEKFHGDSGEKIAKVFKYYKEFFLILRHKLNLLGERDVLSSSSQLDLTKWFGYESLDVFAKEVQVGLSRVSFYADLAIERSKRSIGKIKEYESLKVKSFKEGFRLLSDDQSVMMQYQVRSSITNVFKEDQVSKKQIGTMLRKYLVIEKDDDFWLAIFRSCLLENCIVKLKPLIGLVQRDQYHRYTVSAHILQCLKTVSRIKKKTKKLGGLKFLTDKLNSTDWEIIIWTALYHDIGKGQGGNHSLVGEEMAYADMNEFEIKSSITTEVVWMVKNHLQISRAAFKKNSADKKTWKDLYDAGVTDKRLYRLTLFTVVDIYASNPDAWNSWKEALLVKLVKAMTSTPSSNFRVFLKRLNAEKGGAVESIGSDVLKSQEEFVEALDEFLLKKIPPKVLANDHQKLNQANDKSLPVRIVKNGSYEWVRFHSVNDQTGVFSEQAQKIFALGASIKYVSVRTFKKYGVYNWFLLQSEKDNKHLKRILNSLEKASHDFSSNFPSVKFKKIQIVSQNEKEMVISFRGEDQSGALISAAELIRQNNMSISWAKVNTWGEVLEDIFGVRRGAGNKNDDESSDSLSDDRSDNSEEFFKKSFEGILSNGLE